MHVPRIAFLFWTGERYGGAERRYARLSSHIQNSNLGHVSVFGKRSFLQSLDKLGISMKNCEIFEYRDAKDGKIFNPLVEFMRCLNEIRKSQVDHVHICANPGVISFIYSIFSYWLPPYSISMNAGLYSINAGFLSKRIYLPLSVAWATSVDCLGPRYKNQLMKYAWRRSDPKAYIAPCSFTAPLRSSSNPERDIDVAFAGRFVEGKGLELLVSALGEDEGLILHICGSGPLKVNIEYAKIYHTDSVIDVLRRSKIFLSLQSVDNYPSQSVLEAMAAGCAIIATDVGDTRMFLDETNSVLIQPEPNDLKIAIDLLRDDELLRNTLGSEAKKTLAEKHTIENYCDYFLSRIVA